MSDALIPFDTQTGWQHLQGRLRECNWIVSYIRRLDPLSGVQNFEFDIFVFSEQLILFWV